MSLLKEDIIRKGQVDKAMSRLEFGKSNGDSKKFKVKAICDSGVYARETGGHLPGLYYLVSWKGYPEEENTWEPESAI